MMHVMKVQDKVNKKSSYSCDFKSILSQSFLLNNIVQATHFSKIEIFHLLP